MISHSRERLQRLSWYLPESHRCGSGRHPRSPRSLSRVGTYPGRPSSLSYPVLTGLLREELGFDGLVLTDCMEMQAVTGHYPMGEAAVLAIEAGSDMVLVSHTPKLQEEAFRTVVEAVRSGRIAEKRIDQSLERIARAKEKYVKWPFPEGKVASDEHSRVMAEAYGDSMTVVRNGGLIPLPNRPVVVIETLPHAASLAEEGSPSGATLAQALADLGAEVAAYYITPEVTSEEYEKTTELVERCGLVIMVTQNAHRCARQAELARLVAERCPEHVFIGTRTPYELDLPQVRNYLAAYSSRPETGPGGALGRRRRGVAITLV